MRSHLSAIDRSKELSAASGIPGTSTNDETRVADSPIASKRSWQANEIVLATRGGSG